MFSQRSYVGFLDAYGGGFFKRRIPMSQQKAVLEEVCLQFCDYVYILRDPPTSQALDGAGGMALFDSAKMRIFIALYGSDLIAWFQIKGNAAFYHVHPWGMDEIDSAFAAGLIGGDSVEVSRKRPGKPGRCGCTFLVQNAKEDWSLWPDNTMWRVGQVTPQA